MYCDNCKAYFQPIVRFCVKCGAPNKAAVLLYPPKADRSYKSLLYWQRLIYSNSPEHLCRTADQLCEDSHSIIIRVFEIVADSENLINTTANPTVFFERLDLLYYSLSKLIQLEPFYSFKSPIPSDIMSRICQNENAIIKSFLDRYFYKISENANKLKTDKGKRNQFDRFLTSIEPYDDRISNENHQYYLSLYAKALGALQNNQEVSVIDKPKIKVTCKDYDLSTVQSIRQIPYNDYSVMRDLQKCATDHKRNGDMFLAVECLKKSNQISDYQPDRHLKLLPKEYLRVLKYIESINNPDMLEAEKNAIKKRHPEFWDKRISNRILIQEELTRAHEFGTDLVTVNANKLCPICSQFRYTIYSISGKDRKYTKLPDIVINQTHDCTEHYMSLMLYYRDLED